MTSTTSRCRAAFVLVSLGALAACSSNPPPPPTGAEQVSPTPGPSVSSSPATEAADAGSANAAAVEGSAPTAAKTCTTSRDCAKGEICAGEAGCDKTWTCKPSPPCTRDLATYCGCEGKTFQGSGSCPGQKYKARGAC